MKKLISAALASAMVLSLAACGSTGDSSSAAATTGDTATAEASATDGSTPIKLGGIGPTTGSAASYGIAVMQGEQLAVDEINKAAGHTVFELKFEDDEHDAEKSMNAYNTLKDWGMQVLLGTVTSTPSLSVAGEAVNDNMFMLTPSASAVDVVETGDNVFQMCFTDPNQGIVSSD